MRKISVILMLAISILLASCASNSSNSANKDANVNANESNKKEKLVISTWGLGMDKLTEDIYKPFEEENNCEIVVDSGSTAERYEKLKSNPNYEADVVELSELYSSRALVDNLFEKLDYSKIENVEFLIDQAKEKTSNGEGPAFTTNGIMVLYNPKLIKEGSITKWEDLWKEEFKNQIAIPALSSTFGPAILYMTADVCGVDIKENEDLVFDKLNELKENVVTTYSKGSELVNLMQNEEVSIAIVGDFTYPSIKNVISDIISVYPDNLTYLNFNTININKNSKNKELAYKFINYRISKEVADRTSKSLNEAPVNKNVELSEELSKYMTYGDIVKNAKTIDFAFVNERLSNWLDKFNNTFNQ